MSALLMGCIFALSFVCGNDGEDVEVSQLLKLSEEKKPLQKVSGFDGLKLSAKQLTMAEKHVKDQKDYRSYHLLFAIKNTSKKVYNGLPGETKIMILTSALSEQSNLNDWGYLDTKKSSDGRSAEALLQLGTAAIKHLTPLLEDSTPASLYGSEAGTMSEHYKYRRKDFAYRYVMLILGEQPTFHADPKERDNDIEALKAKLKKDAK
jgi:hypothetical protein